MKSSAVLLLALAMLTGCTDEQDYSSQYDAFVAERSAAKIGSDTDHWIELKNAAGEWEKVGLIFGLLGDFEECEKTIAGFETGELRARLSLRARTNELTRYHDMISVYQ